MADICDIGGAAVERNDAIKTDVYEIAAETVRNGPQRIVEFFVMRLPGLKFVLAACLLSAAAGGSFVPGQARAQQQAASSQAGSDTSTAEDNNGQDLTRPQDLFQLRYLYQTALGSGISRGSVRTVTTYSEILRMDKEFDLGPEWKWALRGDLPFTERNPLTADNPAGNFLQGIGDADVQATVIHQFDARWAAGAGVRIIAPTGDDNLTSGKWQAQPVVGARYSLPELSDGSYFEPVVRYAVSFAGDPSKRDISNLQFAPMFNVALPDHWFVTFYPTPDIRLNYGDAITGQTGRLFLPLDFMVGRSVGKALTISAEFGVPIIRDYPVYNFKSLARLNFRF